MDDMDDAAMTDDFNARTAQFEHWLQTAGVTASDKIKLVDLRKQSVGRAVIATQDISDDEKLFSIPRSAILTLHTSDLPEAIRGRINDPWLCLILAMIYEDQQGGMSKWQPYFDVLPNDFDTLMYWTDDQLQYLEASAVVNKIGRQSADKAFKEKIVPVLQENSELFNGLGMSEANILRTCHRMGSIIMAYAFDLERTSSDPQPEQQDGWEEDSDAGSGEILPKGMVPLADMLNADADMNNAKLFYEDDKVVMKAIKDVKAGEELFNDYGPLPSADVLRRYGYVTGNYAKYDVVEVSLNLIKTTAREQLRMSDQDIEARTAYIDEHGALDEGYDIAHPYNEEGQFEAEFCILLNALTISKEDFEKMRRKEKLPKAELSKESLQLLYAILVRRRSMYPEQVKGAETNYEQGARRREMARQVIEGEKRVLQEAAETVQDQLNDGGKRKADTFEEESQALRVSTKEAKTG